MRGLIPDQIISDVQSRLDIVEVISSYIPLKNAGRNLKAVCPFHSEKTPSFMVNPEKQIFHCFGCGAGGDVFAFVMKHESLNFPEAVEMLAQRLGIVITHTQDADSAIRKKNYYELMEKIACYFEETFLKHAQAKAAREYLRSRNLNMRSVNTFRIGYCLERDEEVLDQFKKLKLDFPALKQIGVLTEDGALRFRGRLIFPIADVQGRIVGYGGRVLDDRLPKYLNSPETIFFKKSQLLYGLHLAKKSILSKSRAVLVEGYIDVISVFCAGVSHVVATLGTAFNDSHVRLLRRYAQEVVVSYDGDAAGIEASLRAMEVFLAQDMIVKVLTIPEGHDPDSWIRLHGKESFESMIEKAPSMLDFKFDLLCGRFDMKGEKGKMQIINEMLHSLKKLKNAVLIDHYVNHVAARLKVDEAAIRQEFKKGKRDFIHIKKDTVSANLPGSLPLEGQFLKLLISHPKLIESVRNVIQETDFKDELYKSLYQNMLKSNFNFRESLEQDISGLVARLAIEDESPAINVDLTLHKFVTALKKRRYEKRQEKLIQLLEVPSASEKRDEILREIQEIQNEIVKLKRM